MANGSTRGVFKSSIEVVITSPTKRPRTHVRAQAASNRTCDAACFAAQEGGNDAIYIYQRLAHAKNDVAWHQGDSVATKKEFTVSGSGLHIGFRKSSWREGRVGIVRRGGVVPVGDVSLFETKQYIHRQRKLSIISHCLMPTNNCPIRKNLAIP